MRPAIRQFALSLGLATAGVTAGLGGAGLARAQGAAPQKVAIVDVQRCIAETAQGQKIKGELEDGLAKKTAEIERKAKALQREAQELRAKAAMLSPDEVGRRQQALALKEAELQELYEKSMDDLAKKEQLLAEKMLKNLGQIVKEIASAEDLDVVLVKSPGTVLFANPKLDITNRVIVAYDKRFK